MFSFGYSLNGRGRVRGEKCALRGKRSLDEIKNELHTTARKEGG